MMNDSPLVSIIIPTYNREKLIIKALDSIFAQTLQDFEVLIIDDASTDNTEQVILDLKNDKIKYIKLPKNGGQCIARNVGIKMARGRYIAFLDSDDEWLPEKIEKQVLCFKNGPDNLGCVYGYAYQKDVIREQTRLIDSGFFRGDIYDKFIEGFCPPTPSLFMVKKEALLKVGGFDESLVTFVDLDLWLRISKDYLFDYVEEPLIIKYEQIGDQYINNFEKRYKGFKLFDAKWRDEIKQKTGPSGLLAFRRNLAMALAVPILDHPPQNLRRNIPKLIYLLILVRSTRERFYTKSILILLFGPKVIYFLRRKLFQK